MPLFLLIFQCKHYTILGFSFGVTLVHVLLSRDLGVILKLSPSFYASHQYLEIILTGERNPLPPQIKMCL